MIRKCTKKLIMGFIVVANFGALTGCKLSEKSNVNGVNKETAAISQNSEKDKKNEKVDTKEAVKDVTKDAGDTNVIDDSKQNSKSIDYKQYNNDTKASTQADKTNSLKNNNSSTKTSNISKANAAIKTNAAAKTNVATRTNSTSKTSNNKITKTSTNSGDKKSSDLSKNNRYYVGGIDNATEFEATFNKLKTLVKDSKKEEVSKYVRYPISIKINGVKTQIKSEGDFIKNYDKIMTTEVKNAFVNQNVKDTFVNYQGVMVGNGEMWFAKCDKNKVKYCIIAINN